MFNPMASKYLKYREKYEEANVDPKNRESTRKNLLEISKMSSSEIGFALVEFRRAWYKEANKLSKNTQKELLNEIKNDFPDIRF